MGEILTIEPIMYWSHPYGNGYTKKDYVRHIIYTDKYLVWGSIYPVFIPQVSPKMQESNQKTQTSDSAKGLKIQVSLYAEKLTQ